jgi:hypothetical protein
MRIVLTKAGKKEIIMDEIENVPEKNYSSEEKVKYSPKLTISSKKRESVQYNLKRFSDINEKNSSAKRLLTDASLANKTKQLRKSLTTKGPKNFDLNEDRKNSMKYVDIKSSRRLVTKELDNIYSINEKVEENENIFDIKKVKNKVKIKYLNNGFALPLIKNSVPLSNILQDKNSKNINKRILKKEINKNENHLINYLKLDKTIKPSFIEKLNKADNDRLVKLDKICQKYFNDKKRNDIIQQNIQDKIKLEYSNDSKYCRENLINLQKDIQNYKKIYKSYFNLYHFKHNK